MNKIIKRTLQTLVAGAIVSGTYFGRGNDDFPPLYSHKTGDAYGINVAVYTKIDSGASINGFNISALSLNSGTVNGVNASLRNEADPLSFKHQVFGKVNGLEIGLRNSTEGWGSSISGDGYARNGSTVNGLAVGIINSHSKLNGVQIGICNETKNNAGVLLNVDYQK
ncbi:MAG: hypothetical protein WC758_03340 [Candidatus Woesearchaeota archaeon]|jgi:hypothetical protein